MNITLIGMPGSGKTFIGKLLAQKLDFNFLNTDSLIENEYNIPLPAVIKKIGEKKFLQKEENILVSNTSGKDRLVISPGGSIIYSPTAMAHLKKISTVVYLQTSLPVIETRIGAVPRGIIGTGTKTISQIFSQRTPLYKKWANITVNGDNTDQTVTQEILLKLKEIHFDFSK